MQWWLKARRAPTLLLTAMLVFLLLVLVMQDFVAQLPSLLGAGANQVVAMLLAPLPLYATLTVCLENRPAGVEDSAVRRTALWDAALCLAVVMWATVVGVVIHALTGSSTALSVGRNTAFLVGLMLCARLLVGNPSVIAPVMWTLVVVLLGFDATHHPYFWTVIPRVPEDPIALAGAAVALAAGLVAQLTNPNEPFLSSIRT